jgi:predicted NAD-dependent protein-ADP-ribosyltransferase YbiA (DUF1768 family)
MTTSCLSTEYINKNRRMMAEHTPQQKLEQWLRGNGVDTRTRIMFFSGSAQKPPGKGAQERLVPRHGMDIATLEQYKDFRRQLSNFSAHHVVVKMPARAIDPPDQNVVMKYFSCVEAAYQYAKFYVNGLENANDRVTSLLDPSINGLEARKLRKAVSLNAMQLGVWAHEMPAFMSTVLEYKFRYHEVPRKILLATGNAHLIHSFGRFGGTHGTLDKKNRLVDLTQKELMDVRHVLQYEALENERK